MFSAAQLLGYLAFGLGLTAFLQSRDVRLKFFNATQGVVYALHFLLLGNFPASVSALISSTRSFLAIRYRSLWLAGAIVVVNVAAGLLLVQRSTGWLPVMASCAATIAIFTTRGLVLRGVLLCCTLMWLANNILSGSIGGTMLEITSAAVNVSTMVRMRRGYLTSSRKKFSNSFGPGS